MAARPIAPYRRLVVDGGTSPARRSPLSALATGGNRLAGSGQLAMTTDSVGGTRTISERRTAPSAHRFLVRATDRDRGRDLCRALPCGLAAGGGRAIGLAAGQARGSWSRSLRGGPGLGSDLAAIRSIRGPCLRVAAPVPGAGRGFPPPPARRWRLVPGAPRGSFVPCGGASDRCSRTRRVRVLRLDVLGWLRPVEPLLVAARPARRPARRRGDKGWVRSWFAGVGVQPGVRNGRAVGGPARPTSPARALSSRPRALARPRHSGTSPSGVASRSLGVRVA
jgi:hypothetical protein